MLEPEIGEIVQCRGLQSGAAAETDGEIERDIVINYAALQAMGLHDEAGQNNRHFSVARRAIAEAAEIIEILINDRQIRAAFWLN